MRARAPSRPIPRPAPGRPGAGVPLPLLTLALLLLALGTRAPLAALPPPPVGAESGARLLGRAMTLSAGAARERLARLPARRWPGERDEASAPRAAGGEEEALDGVAVVAWREQSARPAPGPAAVDGLSVTARAPWWDGAGGGSLGRVELLFLDTDLPAPEAARRLALLPEVEFAEPYRVHRTCALPDDALLGEQLNLVLAGAPGAWDLARGSDFPAVVAVVDGGMDIAHPDLAANVWLNPGDPHDGVDNDGNGFVDDERGWNFATGGDDPGALAAATPRSVRHGTHVAGLVSAVADNGLQIAGLSWNAPVLCVAAGDATRDDLVLFGYQGILYAAERGAKVINCSWGRLLTASLLERAVLARVEELGAVVVAAAGNDGNVFPFYPAAYPNVVAVANIDDAGARHPTSNWGLWVDIAAPGTDVLSLFPGGQTGRLTGTSMASPLVAATMGLIRGREPGLRPAAARLRLLAGARLLPAWRADGAPGLGGGALDAGASLGWRGPGPELAGVEVSDGEGDGDGVVEPGETIALRPLWRNGLEPDAGRWRVELTAPAAYAQVETGVAALWVPAGGDAVAPETPLRLRIAPDVPAGTSLALVWEVSGESSGTPWRQRRTSDLGVAPLHHDLTAGELQVTLAGNGRLGFAGRGGGDGADGIGVRWAPGGETGGAAPAPNLLFEGALMLGTGPGRISDAARYSPLGAFRRDLNPATPHDAPRALPDAVLPFTGERLARAGARFDDRQAAAALPVRVRWLLLAPRGARPAGTTLLQATVVNVGDSTLTGLRYGYFLDWDLNGEGWFPAFRANATLWDAQAGLALTRRADEPDLLNVATALVPEAGGPVRCRPIANDGSAGDWGVYDGFLDSEKWAALSEDSGLDAVGATDVSQVVAGGPVDLAPGDSARFTLVLAAGATSSDARAHAAAGIALARRLFTLPIDAGPPAPFAVGAPRPNPGHGAVTLPVAGNPLAPWELIVYDLRGRRLQRQAPALAPSGGALRWDGRDAAGREVPAGVYLLRVGQEGRYATRLVTRVR